MSNKKTVSEVFTTLTAAIKKSGQEDALLKQLDITSLDDLAMKNLIDTEPQPAPVVMKPTASGAITTHKPLPFAVAEEAPAAHKPQADSAMLKPYIGLNVRYVSRKTRSTYQPSAYMMDYIIHLINDILCDSFYFKKDCPDYHPYIIRLYYGILFWVQCLRAAHSVNALEPEQHQFLMRFLDNYPPESLTISSPLLNLFKTLCASQPEIPTYGKVHPTVPTSPGPSRRDQFMVDSAASFFLPNIPGIFALLEDLNAKINPSGDQNVVYPAKGKHFPVPSGTRGQATIFGHFSFPGSANITEAQRWMLASSGLQYPCEADKKLNEAFAQSYASYGFPATAPTNDLSVIDAYFCMNGSISWFAQVRDTAAIEASYFDGSGTLADCHPSGIVSNQIQIFYINSRKAPTAPNHSADPAALFPFSFQMKTTSRSISELAEAMAAYAQTHIHAPTNHPKFADFGQLLAESGPFWQIRPIESSPKDDSSYLDLDSIMRGLFKSKP